MDSQHNVLDRMVGAPILPAPVLPDNLATQARVARRYIFQSKCWGQHYDMSRLMAVVVIWAAGADCA